MHGDLLTADPVSCWARCQLSSTNPCRERGRQPRQSEASHPRKVWLFLFSSFCAKLNNASAGQSGSFDSGQLCLLFCLQFIITPTGVVGEAFLMGYLVLGCSCKSEEAWCCWGGSACLFQASEAILIQVFSLCIWTSSLPDACSHLQLMKALPLLVMVIWLKWPVLPFPVTWISTEYKVTCPSASNAGLGLRWPQLLPSTSA